MMVAKDEDGITDGWTYVNVGKWWWRRRLPAAWIVEGTMSIQCLCPYCAYGTGYNEPILIPELNSDIKILKCKKCKTEFYGPVI